MRADLRSAGTVDAVTSTATRGARVRHLLGEVVRFLAVGGVATLVSILGFNALVHGWGPGPAPMADQPIAAYVLANAVAGVLAFVGLRTWTFRDRDVRDPATGLARFFALGALTMTIPVLFLWVSRYVLGLSSPLADNLAANVLGLGVATATRFWAFRRFVFDQPAAGTPSSSPA
jgi:putative flippase GtrA